MLGSFHLYPTASLLTELVQIFQGKYIVKASLQIEGVTRVTGMAAAEILEDAEDRARVRVITIFGEVPNIQPQPTVVEAAKPDVIAATSMDTSDTQLPLGQASLRLPRRDTPSEPLIPVDTLHEPERTLEPLAATVVQQTEPTLPKIDVVTSTTTIEKEAPVTEAVQVVPLKPEVAAAITDKHPVPIPDLVQEEVAVPVETTATTNAIKTPEATPQAAIAFDSTPEVSIALPINQEISQVPAVTIKPESPTEPLFELPLENIVTLETQPELPLTAVAPPSNVTPFVPRNYNPPTEIGIPDVPATAQTTTKRTKKTTQPKDNSDDIAKIAVEMERLRWTIEQGRDYLFQTYGKKSRHSLSDDELRDFREYLESQLTSTEDPLAIDPIAGF